MSANDRWAEIAREADLSDEDLAVVRPIYASLVEIAGVPHGQITRAANRAWLEAHRPAAGTPLRRLADLVRLGRSQVKLFGLPFWLVSLTVMLAGAGAEAVGLDASRTIAFYLAGPLLAYVATATAFRGQNGGPQELELSTLVTARVLLVVRLFLILSYDIVIGLLASLPFAITGVSTLTAITLAWLSPLLLVTGVTLLVTAWMRVEHAGALTYGAWAVIVIASARSAIAPASMLLMLEVLMVAIALLLLSVVILAVPGRFKLVHGATRA